VRAVEIVVDPPLFDALAGITVAAEQVLVEALVPQPSVEAFHEAVLHRLAGRDVMPFDLPLFLPCEHGVRGQFGAVVGDDHTRVAAPLGNGVELTGDPNLCRPLDMSALGHVWAAPFWQDVSDDNQPVPDRFKSKLGGGGLYDIACLRSRRRVQTSTFI